MRQIILSDQYNTYEIIKEEKNNWVREILLFLGLPENEINENNKDILVKNNIQIWDDLQYGDIEIIQNDILIGKWYAPVLELKYDEKNKLYYEIQLDYESIIDNEISFES